MAERPSAADLYRRYSESNASGQTREPRSAREAYNVRRQQADERLARPPRPSAGQGNRPPRGPSEKEMAE